MRTEVPGCTLLLSHGDLPLPLPLYALPALRR
jgi:hypothetical protein